MATESPRVWVCVDTRISGTQCTVTSNARLDRRKSYITWRTQTSLAFFNPLRLLLPKELLTVQRLRTRFRRLFYTRGIMRGVYGVAESRQR